MGIEPNSCDKTEIKIFDKVNYFALNESKASKRVGIYVDYPNLIGGAINHRAYADFEFLKRTSDNLGRVVIAKCYAINNCSEKDKYAFLKLERLGFKLELRETPTNDSSRRKDIDPILITDYMQDIYNSNLDIMIIVSDDSDFVHPMRVAKEKGIKCIAIVSEYKKARVLAETADAYLEEQYIPRMPTIYIGGTE